jgi:hypothetical protein
VAESRSGLSPTFQAFILSFGLDKTSEFGAPTSLPVAERMKIVFTRVKVFTLKKTSVKVFLFERDKG